MGGTLAQIVGLTVQKQTFFQGTCQTWEGFGAT